MHVHVCMITCNMCLALLPLYNINCTFFIMYMYMFSKNGISFVHIRSFVCLVSDLFICFLYLFIYYYFMFLPAVG